MMYVKNSLMAGRSTVSVEQELELIEKFNCQVVTIDDAVYLQPLRKICNPL